jgi:hypothetical protein
MDTAFLKQLTGGFTSNRIVAAKAIRKFQEQYPDAFATAAGEILREAGNDPGSRFLLSTFLAHPGQLAILCDPRRFTIDQSTRLVQQVKALDPLAESPARRYGLLVG